MEPFSPPKGGAIPVAPVVALVVAFVVAIVFGIVMEERKDVGERKKDESSEAKCKEERVATLSSLSILSSTFLATFPAPLPVTALVSFSLSTVLPIGISSSFFSVKPGSILILNGLAELAE